MVCRLLSLLLDTIQRVVHVIWTIQKYLDVNVCLVWMVWMVWLHWFGLVRWRQKMEILSAWNNWPMEASRDLNVFPCVSLSVYLPIRLWLPLFASSPLCLLKVFYFHRLCMSVCLPVYLSTSPCASLCVYQLHPTEDYNFLVMDSLRLTPEGQTTAAAASGALYYCLSVCWSFSVRLRFQPLRLSVSKGRHVRCARLQDVKRRKDKHEQTHR